MGVSSGVVPMYFLAVLLGVISQIYGQYGYTPYGQYYPGQSSVYNPYPYQPYVSNQPVPYSPYYGYPGQSYVPQSYPVYDHPAQSYPAQPYPAQSYPAQSYPAQSYPAQTYPVQSYPAQTYPVQSYPAQTYEGQYYPTQQNNYYPSAYPQYPVAPSYVRYPSVNNTSNNTDNSTKDPYPNPKVNISYPAQTYPVQYFPAQTYEGQYYPVQQNNYYPPAYPQYPVAPSYVQSFNNTSNNTDNSAIDPYANLKVDIIDVEPQYFNYYKRFFNLEDNTYPVNVIDDTPGGGSVQLQPQAQPQYTVKTESKSYNFTSVPQTINKHDVKSKTYSFKRTFTVDPKKKENAVINLNFVNGVQVTTAEPVVELADQAQTTVAPPVTEEIQATTTESEEPLNILSWINKN